jgi:hypothetical protein
MSKRSFYEVSISRPSKVLQPPSLAGESHDPQYSNKNRERDLKHFECVSADHDSENRKSYPASKDMLVRAIHEAEAGGCDLIKKQTNANQR